MENRQKTTGSKKKKGTGNSNEGQTTSVLMVPYTSRVLAERVKTTIKTFPAPEGTCTRVQEGGGKRLKDQLIRPDPVRKERCTRSDCRTIVKGTNGAGCRETCYQGNVNYEITCDLCEEKRVEDGSNIQHLYDGESSRGTYERLKGHLDQYKSKKGFMWKHAEECHNGSMDLKFSIRRVASDPDPMRRILRESIRITNGEEREDIKLMNTKEEFFGVKTIRSTFSQE